MIDSPLFPRKADPRRDDGEATAPVATGEMPAASGLETGGAESDAAPEAVTGEGAGAPSDADAGGTGAIQVAQLVALPPAAGTPPAVATGTPPDPAGPAAGVIRVTSALTVAMGGDGAAGGLPPLAVPSLRLGDAGGGSSLFLLGSGHTQDTEPNAFGLRTAGGPGPGSGGAVFVGTHGPDAFVGTAARDLFDFARVPNSLQSGDRVVGGGGDDRLIARLDGAVTIDGSLSIRNVPTIDVTVTGGTAVIDASGIVGPATLQLHGPGGVSVDHLNVSLDGDDLIGALRAQAGAGGLVLRGGAGNDTITTAAAGGGPGGSLVAGGAGVNLLQGGAGDWLDFSRAAGPVALDFGAGVAVNGSGGLDLVNGFTRAIGGVGPLDSAALAAGMTAVLSGFEIVHGAGGTETLVLGAPGSVLVDRVEVVQGSAGNDTIIVADPAGSGNHVFAGGGGSDALVVLTAGHTDRIAGFAMVTYADLGDPAGRHGNDVTLVTVPAGGTRIDFLGSHPGDVLHLQAPNASSVYASVPVTVSGAEVIDGAAAMMLPSYQVTVTGTPTASLQVTLNGVMDRLTFDTSAGVTATTTWVETVTGSAFGDTLTLTGAVSVSAGGGDDRITLLTGATVELGAGNNTLVGDGSNSTLSYEHAVAGVTVDVPSHQTSANGFGGHDTFSGVTGLRGSAFADTFTVDRMIQSVTGGGGTDTVHLADMYGGVLQIDGVAQVDVIGPATNWHLYADVNHLAPVTDIDLTGATNSWLTFDSASAQTLTISGTAAVGRIGMHGLHGLVLSGNADYDVTFDGTVLNGAGLQINSGSTSESTHLRLDVSLESGAVTVAAGAGSDTLIGNADDTLLDGDSSQAWFHVAGLQSSGLSGVINHGVNTADQATHPTDSFTGFGHLIGNTLYYNSQLVIDAPVSGIAAIDLQTGAVTGSGGTASVYGFHAVTNHSASALSIRGTDDLNIQDELAAGSGGDTLTGQRGADTLTGGAGSDHFVYASAADSSYSSNPSYGPSYTDLIRSFQDGGPAHDVIDVSALTAATQHFTGDKSLPSSSLSGTALFAAAFSGDQAGDVDYLITSSYGNATTWLHVASGAGYSASDLIVRLDGAHALTAANVQLHP